MSNKEFAKLETLALLMKIAAAPKADLEKVHTWMNAVIIEYARLLAQIIDEPHPGRPTGTLLALWAQAESNVMERSVIPLVSDMNGVMPVDQTKLRLWKFYIEAYKMHPEIDSPSESWQRCKLCWDLRELYSECPKEAWNGWTPRDR